MKHLFYVHSNITLLSCLAVIQKNNLSDITILFGRGYSNSYINLESYQIIHLPKLITELDKIPTTGIFKPLWILKRLYFLDKMLNEVNGPFQSYLPHTGNFLMQAIITHIGCIKYNIIDEGLLNYTNPDFFIKRTNPEYGRRFLIERLIKYLSYFNRSVVYKSIKAELNTIYLFNQTDFKKLHYTFTQIEYPNLNLEIRSMNNEYVFVFDNSIQDNVIEEDAFYNLITQVFRNFRGVHLNIKFHPAQINRDKIHSLLLELGVKFSILPNDLPLELVFVKSTNMTIYGIWSSLLFYAARSNHVVISYAKTAGNISQKAREWTESHIPDTFYKHIQLR